jgi:hypothetical protein
MAAHEDELCVALTRIALAGDGVVLGIGMTVLALRTWLKYRAHSKALKELEETPLSRIADLRSLGDDGSNQEEQGSFCMMMTPRGWKQIRDFHSAAYYGRGGGGGTQHSHRNFRQSNNKKKQQQQQL